MTLLRSSNLAKLLSWAMLSRKCVMNAKAKICMCCMELKDKKMLGIPVKVKLKGIVSQLYHNIEFTVQNVQNVVKCVY